VTAQGTILQSQIAALAVDLMAWKPTVRLLATTNQTLSGLPIISEVQTDEGDDVVLAGQTNGANNGAWIVQENGWKRRGDLDSSEKAVLGITWRVREGTHAGELWHLSGPTGPITLNTTALEISEDVAGNVEDPLAVETIVVDDQMTMTDGLIQVDDGVGFKELGDKFRAVATDDIPFVIGTFTLPTNSVGKFAIHVFGRDQDGTGVFLQGSLCMFITDGAGITNFAPFPLHDTVAEGTLAAADVTPSTSDFDVDINVTSYATHDVDWVVRVELASLESSAAF